MAGGTLVVRFVGDVREFQRSVASIQRSFAGLVGASFAAGQALRDALQLDQAFTRIDALTNTSAANLERFRGQVMDLAGTTARAPQELADAMFFLSSSGLSARQAMQALDVSAKAAAVGLGRTEDIARIVSQALNAYADSGLTAQQATDTLVAAVREGSAAPEEFATALGRILPVAHQAGVGFDEVTASLAALSNIGLDVDEGVTAMRGLLQALEAPTKQTTQALDALGISTDQLRSIISEQGVLAALRLLMERSGGNLDVLRDLVPNVRALTGALGLTGQEAAKVDGIFQRVTHSSGSLNEAFRVTSQSESFRFAQAMQDIRTELSRLGGSVLPLVADSLRLVADNVDAVVAAFAAWKITQIVVQIGTLTGALKALDTAATGPVGAVVGLAATFAYAGAQANKLADELGLTEETLQRMPSAGRSGVSAAFALARAHRVTGDVVTAANDNMAARWTAMGQAAWSASGTAQDALDGVGDAAARAAKRVTVFADMTAQQFEEWRGQLRDDLASVSDALRQVAEDGRVTAKEMLRSFRQQAQDLASYRANWEALVQRGLPDELLQQIVEMGLDGAGIVRALANANDAQFRRIIAKWRESQREARGVASAIGRIREELDSLPTSKTVTVHLQTLASGVGGHGTQMADGGIVTRPTLALVGEAGPEAVVPLDRVSSVSPLDPDEFARALARELSRRRRPLNLVVDRRRFVDASDVEYVWGGRW